MAALARGCAILGTGGGGEVYTGSLVTLEALRVHGPVQVVELSELDPEGLLLPLGMIGAPTVGVEKLPSGDEGVRLRDHLEVVTGRRAVAVMSSEIGGSNGLLPVAWAAQMGLPLVDADSMGRAFPEVHQVSQHVAGRTPDLIALVDAIGSVVTLRAADGAWAERISRAVTVAFGGTAAMADYVMSVGEAHGVVIEGSVSRALEIGRAIGGAAGDPVAALIDVVARRAPDRRQGRRRRAAHDGWLRARERARGGQRGRRAAGSCGSRSRTRTSWRSRTGSSARRCPT